MHAAAAVLLGDIAGRIGSAEQRFRRDALVANLDHANTDTDIEHMLLPGEAVARDRSADFFADAPGLVERTTDQQHSELVAADACDGVRIPHLLLQERGDLAQQVVARDVAARIVDRLEPIEIEVRDHMRNGVGACRLERGVEPTLEFAAIHEARQCVVRRLIRHLARDAARFADVVKDDDAADDRARGAADRRRGELGRKLPLLDLAQQRRSPPGIHAAPLCEALLHRIAERLSIDLIDERDQLAETLADRKAARRADQLLGGLIHVIDNALPVGRHDPFADRLERQARLRNAAIKPGIDTLVPAHVARDRHKRGTALPDRPPAVQLRPLLLVAATGELHLERPFHRLVGEQRV